MAASLKHKAVRGVTWSFIDNSANQGITFLVGLVLARLLSPEEYGIIGIVVIFIAVFDCIVDSGFSNALIRKNNADKLDYNTTFIFNLILSILLYIVLYVSSPAIANFFSQPILISVMRVMGVVVVINAIALIQRTILIKQVDFKTQTKISLIASLSSGGIGIGMAVGGLGVWSLVGQQISRQFLNSFFLCVYTRWRPQFLFSFYRFRMLFNFGWKLLISGLIDTIWKEIYQVIIGKWYSTDILGQYTQANQFNKIFSSNLTFVVQRVSYPVLSEIQNDQKQLKLAYKKIIKMTMFVTFTCILGLAASAKSMILVLVGEQWLPCVPFLQIICFSGMMYPLHALNLNMLKVKGRSDVFLILEIIKKLIAIGPLLLGIFVGIYWMLWGSVIIGFFAYYLNGYYSGKDVNYGISEQVKDIFPSFMIALIMALFVYLMSYLRISPFVLFPLQIITGVLLVIVLSELLKRDEYLEIKMILLNVLDRIKYGK
ncbi:lipopolysaccharide biosynthesis protein [Butyricimonas hominis]|uniref:lipopolysaccharide biosynthesis protein n=1 Tax=Butyricimonas TaxID=574697 RepID=UPI0035150CDD